MDFFTGGGWEGNVVNIHSTAQEVCVVYCLHLLLGGLGTDPFVRLIRRSQQPATHHAVQRELNALGVS